LKKKKGIIPGMSLASFLRFQINAFIGFSPDMESYWRTDEGCSAAISFVLLLFECRTDLRPGERKKVETPSRINFLEKEFKKMLKK